MLNETLEILQSHQRFVITTHQRPDGDAIGSQISLGRFLTHLGKDVLLLNSDPAPPSLDWMIGSEKIQTENTIENLEAISKADVFVVVDANTKDRLGKTVERALKAYKGNILLIDHHTAPESWFTWMLRDEDAAATAVLIYDLICQYDPALIDPQIATALYTAVMTDTGSFRFSAVSSKVLKMAADLLERGSDSPSTVYSRVYQNHSRMWPRLVSMVFQDITFWNNGRLALISITRKMLESSSVDQGETHGLTDLIMSIGDVCVMVMLTETRHGIKVSFRSKGDYQVDSWAQRFGGGGHQNAAGAFLRHPMYEAVDIVIDSTPEFFSKDTIIQDDLPHYT
ncbi:MAG: bifunctional oligoribonuclease/PAP phosphatase NrnA [Bacteroidetes bacterium]|nr:bifunctional oligoribonuclease/PAP phosphatase NrnA [Bacteroidota bacterium]